MATRLRVRRQVATSFLMYARRLGSARGGGSMAWSLRTPMDWLDREVRSRLGGGPKRRMASMKRGVGYCENTDCEDYAKGVFLLNHGDTFYCPRCRQLGKVEKERGFYTGNTDIFKEVRVEYNFDPINSVYREIAIVRDESLWGRNNVYTLQSPLIKTEKRALKVAEAILANLNRYRGLLNGDDIPRTTEIILSFDDDFTDFSRKLHQLSKEWEASGLREGQR
jgi:hypothetical protein